MSTQRSGSWCPARLCVLMAVAAMGCEDSTAVLIHFASDPALTGSASLAPRLATLQLLLDADEGFAGLEDAAAPEGLRAVDPDGDGHSELLLELNVSGREQLPVVRLDAGRNTGRTIAMQARGLDDAGQLVAQGGLPGRSLFVAGTLTQATVPFDLRRALQPPRLLGAAPHALPVGFTLDAVSFHASRPLLPRSLDGRVHVSLVLGGGGRVAVPGQLLASQACAFGSEMWTFAADACQDSGPYQGVEIRFDAGVTDLEGQPLRDSAGAEAVTVLLELELAGFGPCAASNPCQVHGRLGTMQDSDVTCDAASGRFAPAACTLVRDACLDARDVRTWITADSEAGCQQLRPDAILAAGSYCVVRDPWPCDHQWDCQPVNASCNRSFGQCLPEACEDSCSDAALACAAGGCRPRVGTCGEDCRLGGGCPELGQRCVVENGDSPSCQ